MVGVNFVVRAWEWLAHDLLWRSPTYARYATALNNRVAEWDRRRYRTENLVLAESLRRVGAPDLAERLERL